MHEKYAGKGLVVVSVSLDKSTDDPDTQSARALKFLQKQRASFTNLLLDEQTPVWQEKFDISAPPAQFVFDRRGKWTKFVPVEDNPIDHAAVEKLVVDLLAEK